MLNGKDISRATQAHILNTIHLQGTVWIFDDKVIWGQLREAFQWWVIDNKQFFTNLEGTGKKYTWRYYIIHYGSAHYHCIA